MTQYLTRQDVENFGPDVLDLTQRAALHAISPRLQNLEQQNATLQRQLAKQQRRQMDEAVEAAVPNFREIDRDPRWHRWLLGIDTLTGRVRQNLLNDAISRNSAARAIEFFRRFQQEEAGGTPQTFNRSSGKPIYDRQRIGELYEMHRRGDFKNREAEWSRIENDIFAAQREGRVVDTPYLTK